MLWVLLLTEIQLATPCSKYKKSFLSVTKSILPEKNLFYINIKWDNLMYTSTIRFGLEKSWKTSDQNLQYKWTPGYENPTCKNVNNLSDKRGFS
jgi:hypothetical protein